MIMLIDMPMAKTPFCLYEFGPVMQPKVEITDPALLSESARKRVCSARYLYLDDPLLGHNSRDPHVMGLGGNSAVGDLLFVGEGYDGALKLQ